MWEKVEISSYFTGGAPDFSCLHNCLQISGQNLWQLMAMGLLVLPCGFNMTLIKARAVPKVYSKAFGKQNQACQEGTEPTATPLC